LTKAYTELGLTSSEPFSILENSSQYKFKISNGLGIEEPVVASLVYQQMKNKNLQLAWDFTIYSQDHNHIWSVRIDALSGKLLEKNDQVVSCNFAPKKEFIVNYQLEKFNRTFFKDNTLAIPANVLGGSYRVVPFNYESPNHIARQLISNPEDATASPKGWHDANTLTGTTASLKYTVTRGNNVWARSDYSGGNPTTASTTATANGYSPNGGTGLNFDYAYPGTSAGAGTYIDAACTNLFYMNNISHDIWFHYGFNEANGNFQQTNLTGVSGATDYVYGDAQDGSTAATQTLNNANFSAPADGNKGRMQMYLWSVGPVVNPLFVNLPTDIAGNYNSKQNSFSPGHVDLPIAPAFLQSDLVLFDDGTPDANVTDNADACSPAVNAAALNGKIVLIRRSLAAASGGAPCNFTVKVKNAQLAGAIAVIVFNNVDVTNSAGTPIDAPLGMSGADATITIPAISVSRIVGEMLLAKLALGTVNVKLQLPADYIPFVNTDGDFDNGVIAHEFGHGISIRLTGGKANSGCLNNTDEAGEGWSDWFALMLQLKPGDVGTSKRGIGTFVYSEQPNGDGIRDFPYSTDMTIDPMTYGYTNNYQYTDANGVEQTEIHGTGSVWTTVLWDLTWAYIAKYGYDDNKYTGTGGNNKIMQLVLDALKTQVCSPSFVDSRDALISADQATTGGQDFCMIWDVFARRGLGLNASAGDTNIGNDQVEDFTVPAPGPNCVLAVDYFKNESMIKVYPNPTNGQISINIPKFVGKIAIQVVDLNGRIVYNENTDFNVEKVIDLGAYQSGVYILKVAGDQINYSQKIIKE